MARLDERLSERLGVVGALDPVVVVDTELYTDYIDMSKMEQVLGILQLGDVNAKTFDFRAVGYSDAAAGDATELKDCTQLAAHATANDGKQLVIGIRREDLVAKQTGTVKLRYLRFGVVSQAAQDGPVAIIALGGDFAHGPAADNDLSSVAEIEEDLNA